MTVISVPSETQVAASAPPARSKASEPRTSTAAPDFGSLVDDNTNTPPPPPAASAGADTHLSSRPAPKSAASASGPTGRSQTTADETAATGPQSQGNDQATPGSEDPAKPSRTGIVAAKPGLNGSGIDVSDPSATEAASDGSPATPVATQLTPVAVLVAVALPAANQTGSESSGSQPEGSTSTAGSVSQLKALAALQDAKAAGQKGAAGTSDGANPNAAADGTTTAQTGTAEQAAALTAEAKAAKGGGAKKDGAGSRLVQADLPSQLTTSGSGAAPATQAAAAPAPAGTAAGPAKPATADTIIAKDGSGKPADGAGRDAPAADASPLASLAHRLQADLSAGLPAAGPHAAGAVQGSTVQGSTVQGTGAAAPGSTAPAPQAAAVPLSGLAVEISTQAQSGRNRFEIRLDPPELGRIDVRLDVDKASGQVTSHLTVDKPETLDLLRREAPQLQRALEDAGLKTGDSGLQFSLRDQSSFAGQRDDGQSGRQAQRLIIPDEDTVPAEVAGRSYGRMLGASRGVDIRV